MKIAVIIISILILTSCTTHTSIGDDYNLIVTEIEIKEYYKNNKKQPLSYYIATIKKGRYHDGAIGFYGPRYKFNIGDTLYFLKPQQLTTNN